MDFQRALLISLDFIYCIGFQRFLGILGYGYWKPGTRVKGGTAAPPRTLCSIPGFSWFVWLQLISSFLWIGFSWLCIHFDGFLTLPGIPGCGCLRPGTTVKSGRASPTENFVRFQAGVLASEDLNCTSWICKIPTDFHEFSWFSSILASEDFHSIFNDCYRFT